MSNRKKRDQRLSRGAQLRRDRERAESRRTRMITGSIVAAVVVLVVAAGVAVFASQRGDGESAPGMTDDYGIVYSVDTIDGAEPAEGVESVDVVIYEDFLCPVCGVLEQQIGDYVEEQVNRGVISVEYRPIAILDDESTTDYSTRSASAAACVFDDQGAQGFHDFHDLLFENQPAEGTAGLSDDELIGLAEQAGADNVDSCISGDEYDAWAADATDQASQDNVQGTPTVLVAGEQLQAANPEQGYTLQDLVDAVTAAGGEPVESPSSE